MEIAILQKYTMCVATLLLNRLKLDYLSSSGTGFTFQHTENLYHNTMIDMSLSERVKMYTCSPYTYSSSFVDVICENVAR